jgi:hypothetical protein
MLACVLTSVPADGAVWYVDSTGNDGNSGQSPAEAKQNIQAAVDVAAAGDSVIVADGQYDFAATLTIDKGITVRSTNGAAATVLDGGGERRVVRVLHAAAVLDGFTVQNGRAINGGGIFCEEGTIRNCVIRDNLAVSEEDAARGGGIYLVLGTVSDCEISANRATSNEPFEFSNFAWAGGIFAHGGTIERCVIAANRCEAVYTYGGGVVLIGAELLRSRVESNVSIGKYTASGGGVYATIRELYFPSLIDGCIVAGNTVDANETYTYSSAAAEGGGLRIGNDTMLRSTLVHGNMAQSQYGVARGGGVWTSGSTVINCTVADNTVTANNTLGVGPRSHGGGVHWGYNDACYNNIIQFNTAVNGADNMNVTGFDYPVFEYTNTPLPAGVSAAQSINTDPLFVDRGNGNYRLQAGSPCMGTGIVQGWMAGARDPDTRPRMEGGSVEMGAYANWNAFWSLPETISLGGGWKQNGLGAFWDGGFPYVYFGGSISWVYIVGKNETLFFFYDVALGRWAWAGAGFYPWAVLLGD